MDTFMFWLWKPVAEIALFLAVTLVAFVVYALWQLPAYLKSRRCKHPTVTEDSACNAWCKSCGKNLGFIGAWREKTRARDGSA
jgi:hypothetical protein